MTIITEAARGDLVSLIMALINWLYWQFCDGAGSDGSLAAWAEVLAFRAFAGALWTDAATGMAQQWAIVVDNLIDLIDVANVRGDH